jgi:hypothetical protein
VSQPAEERDSGSQHPDASEPSAAAGQAHAAEPSAAADFARDYAAKAGLERRDDGQIDVLKSVGGLRGLAEGILPGLVFLVVFTVSAQLQAALIASLAVAAVFTIVRLVQRTPVTQALSGLVGVGICAWVANTTGRAEDFYVWGFVTNSAYIAAMLISLAIKWPLAGVAFGFIRGEGVHWRRDRARRRVYNIATWIIITVLALRLAVQVPLYLMGEPGLVALGTTRLLMGVPLYALGLWVAWLVSRPAGVIRAEAQKNAGV